MSEMQGVGDSVDNRTPHGRISGRMQLWSVDKRVTDAMATEALKAIQIPEKKSYEAPSWVNDPYMHLDPQAIYAKAYNDALRDVFGDRA